MSNTGGGSLGGNGPGSASTYQSVIIALVAGSLLTAGVISILYRRRRRRQFLRQIARLTANGTAAGDGAGDTRWVQLANGTLVQVRDRKKKDKLGKEPILFDRVVGESKEKATERVDGEVEVNGKMGDTWRPLNTTTMPTKEKSSEQLSLSILIAMPTPSTDISNHDSPSSSTSSLSYQKPVHLDDYPISYRVPKEMLMTEDNEDDFVLPSVVIGTTSVPICVTSNTKSSWDAIKKEARSNNSSRNKENAEPGSSGTRRVERTDGFRSRNR